MQTPQKQAFRIALVGVEFEENLSLRYLAGALIDAGYENISIQPYNSITEAEEICNLLIRQEVDLVGISMAFQVRAIDDMSFAQLLRKRGFKKHITAGGQFATLHYHEIFKDCPALDSIIRFEAESSIVRLADTLFAQESATAVPGLVWKDGQGIHINAAVPEPGDLDQLPLPFRRSRRPEFLGLKSIHMIGSRGCHATCKYCCVSALASERRAAARDSGNPTAIPGTRRRTARNIANEIALLYFKYDIRIFEFQDDNWIHPNIPVAVAYFTELKEALDEKGIGRIGLTLKTRADSVQPEIIRILKEIGLIRVFVGIESGTQSLLSRLGRKTRDNVSLMALEVLRDLEIPAYFNALLFGPDIRSEDIEPELTFLEHCADFPFEIVEVVIYGKTGLYLSLKEQNRLHGNYLDYEYDYLDVVTQRTHGLITLLETRHFGVYSPVKMAADLGFNLGLLQVFYPGAFTKELALRVKALTERINRDQIRIIRKATRMAHSNLPGEPASEALIAETIPADLQFYQEIISLHTEMEQYVSAIIRNSGISSYYRAGAVIQSGLIAGLFMMLSGNLSSQERSEPVDTMVKRHMVSLIYNPGSSAWKQVKKELLAVKQPLSNYNMAVNNAVVQINRTEPNVYPEKAFKNLKKLRARTEDLTAKRIRQDYERLNKLLSEHNPKIKIASTLRFYLDDNGRVTDIETVNSGDSRELSPELKQTILGLLTEKQFYTYEASGQLSKHAGKEWKKDHRRGKRQQLRYKRMRRGPLD